MVMGAKTRTCVTALQSPASCDADLLHVHACPTVLQQFINVTTTHTYYSVVDTAQWLRTPVQHRAFTVAVLQRLHAVSCSHCMLYVHCPICCPCCLSYQAGSPAALRHSTAKHSTRATVSVGLSHHVYDVYVQPPMIGVDKRSRSAWGPAHAIECIVVATTTPVGSSSSSMLLASLKVHVAQVLHHSALDTILALV